MAKWVHNFIAENFKEWEEERQRRIEEWREKIEQWEKKSRLEKIKTLKMKFVKRKEEDLSTRVEEKGSDDEDEIIRKVAEETEKTWCKWRTTDMDMEIEEVEEIFVEETIEHEEELENFEETKKMMNTSYRN